ncbi:MAG: rhodanese [Planctomycetes bacterium]|nr:rhodanese [Planctomycetota bacterium]
MNPAESSLEISCQEVHQRLQGGEDLLLLDCREPDEHQFVALRGSLLLPMRELPARVSELEPHRARLVVVYCHLGGRSARTAAWLREQGFAARTMEGGIDQWAVEIDPQLPRY